MNSVPTNLWEWLAPIDPGDRVALCATAIVIGLTALVLIIWIVAGTTGKIHRARLENALERELLDRGMSAEEITEVVAATAGPKGQRLNIKGRGSRRRGSMHTLSSFYPLLAQANDYWANMFLGLDESKRFVLLIVAIGCATGVICTVVGCVSGAASSMHRHRLDHELKRDLLDRGMTADEVARVVESSQPKDFLDRWAASCGKKKTG